MMFIEESLVVVNGDGFVWMEFVSFVVVMAAAAVHLADLVLLRPQTCDPFRASRLSVDVHSAKVGKVPSLYDRATPSVPRIRLSTSGRGRNPYLVNRISRSVPRIRGGAIGGALAAPGGGP